MAPRAGGQPAYAGTSTATPRTTLATGSSTACLQGPRASSTCARPRDPLRLSRTAPPRRRGPRRPSAEGRGLACMAPPSWPACATSATVAASSGPPRTRWPRVTPDQPSRLPRASGPLWFFEAPLCSPPTYPPLHGPCRVSGHVGGGLSGQLAPTHSLRQSSQAVWPAQVRWAGGGLGAADPRRGGGAQVACWPGRYTDGVHPPTTRSLTRIVRPGWSQMEG